MKRRTKIILFCFITIGVVVGAFQIYDQFLTHRTAYYTQVTEKGERVNDTGDNGKTYISYQYKLKGYDAKGRSRKLVFTNPDDKPLKQKIYLKVIHDSKRGVVQWQPISQKKIPKQANLKLNE